MLKLRDLLEIKVAKPEVVPLMKVGETFSEYLERLMEMSDLTDLFITYLHGDMRSFYAITPIKKGAHNPAYKTICNLLTKKYKINLKKQQERFYFYADKDETLNEEYQNMVAELQTITLNRDPTVDTLYLESRLPKLNKESEMNEIKVATNSLTSPEKGETVYEYIRRLFEEEKFTERHGRKYRTVIFTAESDQRPAQLVRLLSKVMKVKLSYHPEDAGHYESYQLTYNRNPHTTEIVPAKSKEEVSEIVVDKSPQISQSLKPYKDKLDYYITHSQESDLDEIILKVLTYMLKLLGQDGADLMKEVDLVKLLREVTAYVTAFMDYTKRDLKEIRVEPRQPVLVIGDRYLLFEPNPSVEGWVEAEYVGPYELSTARPYEEFNAQGRTFLIKKRDVLSRVKPAKIQEPKLELEQFEYYEVPGHNNTRVSSRYITRMWDTFYFLVETDTNESNYYVEIPIQEVDQKVKAINKA